MPARNRFSTSAGAFKFANQFTKYAGHNASKAATGLARWATTDHTGTTKLLATMPPLGFFDTVCMVLIQLFFGILGAIGSAIMIVLLFAYGIPLLLFM